MKRNYFIPALLSFTAFMLFAVAASYGQEKSIPEFLKEKQVWNEKLVVIYAPAEQQHIVKEQLDVLYSAISVFKQEKIVVVQIPTALSFSNRMYLKQKLRYHEDRLNVWVIDEKGNLRLSSTKVNSADQLLRVLNIDNRPDALAKARFF